MQGGSHLALSAALPIATAAAQGKHLSQGLSWRDGGRAPSADDVAHATAALLRRLGYQRALFVGHSYGERPLQWLPACFVTCTRAGAAHACEMHFGVSSIHELGTGALLASIAAGTFYVSRICQLYREVRAPCGVPLSACPAKCASFPTAF